MNLSGQFLIKTYKNSQTKLSMICLHSTSHVLIVKALSLCFKKMSFFLSLPRNLVGCWHFRLQYLYCRMLSFWFWHTDEMKPFLWNETLFPYPRYHISALCLFSRGIMPTILHFFPPNALWKLHTFCCILTFSPLNYAFYLCFDNNLKCIVEDNSKKQ